MEQIILRQVRFVQNSNEAGLIIIIIMTRVEGICIEEHSQEARQKEFALFRGQYYELNLTLCQTFIKKRYCCIN